MGLSAIRFPLTTYTPVGGFTLVPTNTGLSAHYAHIQNQVFGELFTVGFSELPVASRMYQLKYHLKNITNHGTLSLELIGADQIANALSDTSIPLALEEGENVIIFQAAANANAAPDMISYIGISFFIIWLNPERKVLRPANFAK